MKAASIVILALLSLLSSVPSRAGQSAADSTYAAMVEKVKAGDTTVDYQELRLAYAASSYYDPYAIPADLDSMQTAFQAGDYHKALHFGQKLLSVNFTDIHIQFGCARAYEALGDSARSAFHEAIAKRLLASIESSGDGKSQPTGYQVVNISDEHSLLKSWEYRTVNREDISFFSMLITARHEFTGKEAKFYFDTSIPIEWGVQRAKEEEKRNRKNTSKKKKK